jgi:hypothetical protein
MKSNQQVRGKVMNYAQPLSVVDDYDFFLSYTFLFLIIIQ